MAAQRVGLLSGGGLQSAGHQAAHGSHGDILHGGQIDLRAGPLFPEGLLADDWAPTSGELLDGLEILGGEGSLRHVLSFLGVASNLGAELLSPMLAKALAAAKQVLHPGSVRRLFFAGRSENRLLK
jgi:hypothetical protein